MDLKLLKNKNPGDSTGEIPITNTQELTAQEPETDFYYGATKVNQTPQPTTLEPPVFYEQPIEPEPVPAPVKSRIKPKKKSRKPLAILIIILVFLLIGGIALLFADIHKSNGVIFCNILKTESGIHSGDLVLVNSDYEYDFDNSPTLVKVSNMKNSSYLVRENDMELARTTVSHLNKMLKAFRKETGIKNVCVNSAYRSYSDQENLFTIRENELGYYGALAVCANAGYSEHHTGLAADLVLLDDDEVTALGSIPEYTFFQTNAKDYGFIIRYPADKEWITHISNEPWHFRYVGKVHAYAMAEDNLCLEEYIEYIKDYSCDEPLEVQIGDKTYCVYYCEGTQVTIPLFKLFNISGNNVDGYVVSYKSGTGSLSR